jgi:hypothetical protein
MVVMVVKNVFCWLSNTLYGGYGGNKTCPPPQGKIKFLHFYNLTNRIQSFLICCYKSVLFDRNFARNFTLFFLLASLHENENSVLLRVTAFIHVWITVRNI